MIAIFSDDAPAYDVGRDGLYALVQKRIKHAQRIAALGIIALLVVWTWGTWWKVGAVVGFHALMIFLNRVVDRRWPSVNDAKAEAPRVVFNHMSGTIFATLVGWPLPMWLWLPFTAVGYHGANAKHAGWVLAGIAVIQGVVATAIGVNPVVPLMFGVLSLGLWNIVHERSSIVAEVISSLERQRDALASAHTELGALHEQLTEQIAARELVEHQLLQSQKLEAMGRLAAGVAHEINTPIQFIGNNLEFIAASTSDLLALAQRCATAQEAETADLSYLREELPSSVAMSMQGVKRVAAIIGSMKQFSHPGGDGASTVDVNTAIHNALTLTMHEYKLVADIETDLGPMPPILANAGDLNQVLINIIVNATHAIVDRYGASGRGAIRIRSSASDNSVVIAISDTGCGIPDEIRSSVFDPFFTTKPVGVGTGQGLAISRSAVQRAGGELTFESEVGKGTTFFIRLPIARPATTRIRRVA
jgi:signal transduction histidine kinase